MKEPEQTAEVFLENEYPNRSKRQGQEFSSDDMIEFATSYASQQTAPLQKQIEEQKIKMGRMGNLWLSEKEKVESLQKQLKESELRYHESIERNIDKRERITSLQKQLEEERKSNHRLHQAMTSAESRGVAKGREEQQQEIERLKNDLQDALDLKQGNGPTALSMLKSRIAELEEALKYARGKAYILYSSKGAVKGGYVKDVDKLFNALDQALQSPPGESEKENVQLDDGNVYAFSGKGWVLVGKMVEGKLVTEESEKENNNQ